MYAVFEFRNTSSYKTWCNRLPQRYPVTSPVAVLTVERPRWSAARQLGRGDSFDADGVYALLIRCVRIAFHWSRS